MNQVYKKTVYSTHTYLIFLKAGQEIVSHLLHVFHWIYLQHGIHQDLENFLLEKKRDNQQEKNIILRNSSTERLNLSTDHQSLM